MKEFVEEKDASSLSENGATETDTAETVIETEAPLDEGIAVSPDKPSDAVTTDGESDGTDYAALARADAEELRAEFPELSSLASVTELDDPVRYGALRDLGLTPREAYLATRKRRDADNRAHLRPTRSVARGAAPLMTEAEMSAARELFSGISDSEIRQLYKRVTK